MTNERYAKKLASMADEMLHPQGCVYDALMAGAAALDEVVALRRDAARYRWLRGRTNVWRDILDGHYRVGFSPLTVSAIEKGKDPACNVLDTAIDAAILEAPNA